MDHLQTTNQLIEKCNEYQIDLHLLLIDYTKAFDSINHHYLLQAPRNQGISECRVKIIENMYTDLKARVRTDVTGSYFNVSKGVRQGDPLSPILFNCLLEEVFRTLNWEKKGLNIQGEYIKDLLMILYLSQII